MRLIPAILAALSLAVLAPGVTPGVAPGVAWAQGSLVLYCSVDESWCRGVTTAFQKETGIRVDMTRLSSIILTVLLL